MYKTHYTNNDEWYEHRFKHLWQVIIKKGVIPSITSVKMFVCTPIEALDLLVIIFDEGHV